MENHTNHTNHISKEVKKKILEERQDFVIKNANIVHKVLTELTIAEAIALLEMEKMWLLGQSMEKIRDFKSTKGIKIGF